MRGWGRNSLITSSPGSGVGASVAVRVSVGVRVGVDVRVGVCVGVLVAVAIRTPSHMAKGLALFCGEEGEIRANRNREANSSSSAIGRGWFRHQQGGHESRPEEDSEGDLGLLQYVLRRIGRG